MPLWLTATLKRKVLALGLLGLSLFVVFAVLIGLYMLERGVYSLSVWLVFFFLIASAFAVPTLAVLLAFNHVLRPIAMLTWAAKRIAEEDFDEPIELGRRDELGTLAHTFDDMRRKLKTSHDELRKRSVELERRVEQLTALNAIDTAILSAPDLEQVLSLVAKSAAGIMGAKECGVAFVDDSGKALVLQSVHGISRKRLEYFNQNVKLRVGEGAAGWAVFEAKPAAIPDIGTDPRYDRLRDLKGFHREGAAVAAPLVVEGKVLGAIYATYDAPRQFEPSEIEFFANFANQTSIAIQDARLVEGMRNLTVETIRALARAIDARDPCTAGHSDLVSSFAVAIATEMGLSAEEIKDVEFAGLLHDIGKLGVSESILNKPGPLDTREMAEMEKHPFLSAQIIKPIEFLRDVVPMVYHHHERYDGLGYLDGLSGQHIPLGARIIAVADAFEAMTSERPYRTALSLKHALQQLRQGSGTHFDPRIVTALVQVIDRTMDGAAELEEERGGARRPQAAAEDLVPVEPSTCGPARVVSSGVLLNGTARSRIQIIAARSTPGDLS